MSPILILLAGIMYAGVHAVAAQDGSPWITNNAPLLAKITDFPGNTQPGGGNVDCTEQMFVIAGQTQPASDCAFMSPLGVLTTGGYINVGGNRLVGLHGPTRLSTFLPTTDPSVALVDLPSSMTGNYIGVYRSLTKAELRYNSTFQGDYYDISVPPDFTLSSPYSGTPLNINAASIAFSANGFWMVADLPHQGLVRINMTTLDTQLFAGSIEPDWYSGVPNVPLAVSNDGRYVAANTDIFGRGIVNMYDLTTCSDQLNVPAQERIFCKGRDIWQGRDLDGGLAGQGILAQEADLQAPMHIRFVDDTSISFTAYYGADRKKAGFMVTAAGYPQHGLGLLGMGDSYISGQGAFEYRNGTDTLINVCHLSELSYPFILGKEFFNSYNSVACSGATTEMLVGTDANFTGQVKDSTPENKRDKQPILANFQPGYIYQREFAAAYKPEAILLSVGGDDIGFLNIVKACISNLDGSTCYDTYEDRAELINQIDAAYAKLVATYTTIRQQSGGARVYVVGYPQVAKPNGDCGLNVHLNSKEVEFSSQLVDYLDGVVQQAAQTAGVFYVDVQHAFDEHRLCESGPKAVNGLTAGNDIGVTIDWQTWGVGSESYHPTPLGYQLLATTIARQTHDLKADMPTPMQFAVPAFDPTIPMLTDVPITNRPIRWVTSDDTIARDFVLRGDTQQVTVDGTGVQLRPGSEYQIVLHSDPILLDEGGVDANGNLSATIHIPADVPPGYHMLHVYGTDMAGNAVDVQKSIYVVAGSDDYDGDGMPNAASLCMFLPASGQDMDRDGIDDACDPELAAPAAGAAVSDRIVADQGIVDASSPSDNPGSDPAGAPPGAVLGDTAQGSPTPLQRSTAVPGRVVGFSAQKPYRVNWLIVLGFGSAITTAGTVLCYVWRRW